jgi:hypothetical protein
MLLFRSTWQERKKLYVGQNANDELLFFRVFLSFRSYIAIVLKEAHCSTFLWGVSVWFLRRVSPNPFLQCCCRVILFFFFFSFRALLPASDKRHIGVWCVSDTNTCPTLGHAHHKQCPCFRACGTTIFRYSDSVKKRGWKKPWGLSRLDVLKKEKKNSEVNCL